MSFGYQILGFGAYPNRVTAEVIVPVAITYVSTAFNGDASTSQTFSSQSLGTAFAGRRIVVAALAEGNAGQTITGITVGGVTLDLHVRLTNGNTEIAIGSRKIATGTAADIIVVTSGQKNRYGIGVWQTNGFPAGLGITDTGTTLTTSTGNDTLLGGGMIAMAGGPSDNPVSWTGVTERYDALVDGFEEFHSGGDEIFEDAQDDRTVSVSTNKNDAANSLGVVSFNSPNRVISVDFIGNTVNSGSSTAYTFSSHDIGEAASNRKIILAIGNAHSTAVAVTAVTVGGISGTEVISQASNNNAFRTQIWQVDEVASGTSADIVVTFASSTDCCGIGVWAAYGASTIPHQFKSDDGVPTLLSEDIDVPAGGFVIGSTQHGSAGSTNTWSAGLYENYDQANEQNHGGAYGYFAAAQSALTVTCTRSAGTTNGAMAVASWGKAFTSAATVTFAGSTVDPTNATTKTFSGHAIGTASLTRKTLVMVDFAGTVGDETVLSVSVGGVTASVLARSNSTGGGRPMEAWLAETPSGTVAGTTADIVVVSNDSNWSEVGIGVYALECGDHYDSFTSQANPGTGQITIPAGGVAVAANLLANSTSATSSFAWSANMTENYDEALDTNTSRHTGASGAFSTFQNEVTITSTPTGDADSQWALVGVSFNPVP